MYIHERHIPLESNIFCGLTSKWTIYFECINSSAWANCLVKFFDSSSVKVFRSPTQYSKISPPIALKIILECQIFFIWLYSVSTGTEIPELWRYDYSIWSHCGAPFFQTKRYPTQRRGYENKNFALLSNIPRALLNICIFRYILGLY